MPFSLRPSPRSLSEAEATIASKDGELEFMRVAAESDVPVAPAVGSSDAVADVSSASGGGREEGDWKVLVQQKLELQEENAFLISELTTAKVMLAEMQMHR